MADPTKQDAGTLFCHAYDEWQTLYAWYRLQGWDPRRGDIPPANLGAAYAAFLAAIDALRIEKLGGARPDYTTIARQRQ